MGSEVLGSKVQGSAQPPAKKTAGQIEKETVPFWPSFIREVLSSQLQVPGYGLNNPEP